MRPERNDPELDAFLEDARQELSGRLESFRPRGFQNALERAVQRRAGAGGTDGHRRRVLEPNPNQWPSNIVDPDFDEFVADARTALRARISARRRRTRRGWAAAGLLAASVAAITMFGDEITVFVQRHDSGMDQATAVVVPSPRTGRARTQAPERQPAATMDRKAESPPEPLPADESVSKDTSLDRPRPRGRKDPHDLAPEPTLEDRLHALDQRAQAHWRAGDRAGAEATYRALIQLAGHGEYAQLAYADLFSLFRQAGQADRLEATWRNYLTTFPRGRFADDARAGLCRATDLDDRVTCWQRYLTDFPRGSYVGEANANLNPPDGEN